MAGDGPGGDVSRVFLGVGIGRYADPAFSDLGAVGEVRTVADLLAARGFTVKVVEDVSDSRAERELIDALPQGGLVGGALVVLWAGHGERTATGDLRLITTDAKPQVAATRTARQVVDLAMRTGASQVLVILDTCFAGGGIPSASAVVEGLREAFPDPSGWVGVFASARSFELADDELFGNELVRVLTEGPRDAHLRLRFDAYNEGFRGDDVIDVVEQEWPTDRQRPDHRHTGVPRVMFPNPLWNPKPPDEVAEHLLLAAEGRSPDEAGSYFTGRRGPLERVVEWLDGSVPGVLVVTGAPGCGKSALVGRIVSLSNPTQRARIVGAEGDPGPDPGEGSIHAHVLARRLTVDGLARAIDAQLNEAGVLPKTEDGRNANELLGVIQREAEAGTLPMPLRVVIDGLDEAEREALGIVVDVVNRLASFAQVMVTTRAITGPDHRDLIAEMSTTEPLDLSAPEWAVETTADVRDYIRRRLEGPTGSGVDPDAVASHLLAVAPGDQGGFLLGRLVTSQLRDKPLDTSVTGWESELATSIETAFDRDLTRIAGVAPCGVAGPVAARGLLTGLTWGYGGGVPDDVWAVIAGALPDAAPYQRDDVYWVLDTVGRYVVSSRGDDTAVYRIPHRSLAQHLRPARPVLQQLEHDPATLPVATAIVNHYESLLDSGEVPESHSYLWKHTWQHCTDAGQPGIELIRRLAEANSEFRGDLAKSLTNLGSRYSEVGRQPEAVTLTEEAVTIHRDLAEADPGLRGDLARSLNNLGVHYVDVGRHGEAVTLTEEAVRIRREVADENPELRGDLARSLANLGSVYLDVGRPDEAVAPTEEAVAIHRGLAETNPGLREDLAGSLNNLGALYRAVGRQDEAMTLIEEAVTIGRAIAEVNPVPSGDLADSLNNLAILYHEVGRQHEAMTLTEEAVTIRRAIAELKPGARGDLASSLNNLGSRYSEVGRWGEAVAVAEEAVTIDRQLAEANPGFLDSLGSALNNLGILYSELGRHPEAVTLSEEAADIYRELAEANPGFRADFASSLGNLGNRYSAVGRHEAAITPTEEAVTIRRALAEANPVYLDDLSASLNDLGILYTAMGRQAEAVAAAEEAVTIRRALAEVNPGSVGDLAGSLNNLVNLYSKAGRPGDALAPIREAVTIQRRLAETNPGSLGELAMTLNNLGVVYREMERSDEAVAPTEESVTIRRGLAETNPGFRGDLASTLNNLGNLYSDLERGDDAAARTEEAVTIYRELAETNPGFRGDLARSLTNLESRYRAVGRQGEAIESAEEAVTVYRELAETNPRFRRDLARSLNNLEDRYCEVGREADAADAWRRAYESVGNGGHAELLTRRARLRGSTADAVADLTAAESLLVDDAHLTSEFHDVARRRRATDARAFDTAWLTAHNVVPEWLTLDPDHLDLVTAWVTTPTYAEEARFAVDHATQLLEGPTSLALTELALDANDPDAMSRRLAILDDAQLRGFPAVYESIVARERIALYIRRSPDDQISMLTENREELLAPAALAALAELTFDYKPGGFGGSLVHLATLGLDTRVLAALDDDTALDVLVDETITDASPDTMLALAQVIVAVKASEARLATGYIVAACGLVLGDHPTEAADAIRAARRVSEGAVQAFLPRLVALAVARPTLVALAPVFGEPAPVEEEA